ncbi:MAG: type II toxin-antitoxin system VapC family toxin [Clostridiales bacterium]|jgi:hypothetical protein|nr:type II toxin-antitoxin system VapC family toxin [Clostridiales bacterium]
MNPSLYLETTIPSYLAARTSSNPVIAIKQSATHEFFESLRHKYDLFVSDYVYEECEKGDEAAAKRRLEWLNGIETLKKTPKIEPLAEIYMQLLSIPKDSAIDARHLAICCIYGIDFLLSWNFKHLGTRSMLIAQKHNDKHGLSTPEMLTPFDLIEKNNEEGSYE